MKTSRLNKGCNFVEKLWKNLHRIPEICATHDNLRARHSKCGVNLHYVDRNTPKGFMSVLKPDGKVTFKKLTNR